MDRDDAALEMREWLEALNSVQAFEGVQRMDDILSEVISEARKNGAQLPFAWNTAYGNTIHPARPARPSGRPRAIETKIRPRSAGTPRRSCCSANKESLRTRRPYRELPVRGDALRYRLHAFLARGDRHASAAIWSISRAIPRPAFTPAPFSKGGSARSNLLNFRQEVGGKGLSSYPHPWLMPDFWQFPTVSMGLGPLMAIYQARFLRYLQGRGLADTDRPQGLGLLRRRRDGRAGIARRDLAGRTRKARQSDLRHQLQPAAARRPGARQRQDRSGARGRFPRRRLERHQMRLGLGLGRLAGRDIDRHAAPVDGRMRRRRISGFQVEERRLYPREFLRPLSRDRGDGRRLDATRRSGR